MTEKTVIAAIVDWFNDLLRKRQNKKVYNRLKKKLNESEEAKEQAKKRFENAFGASRETRTKAQWQRLVKVYGITTVCNTEKLSQKEVETYCNKNFTLNQRKQRFEREKLKAEAELIREEILNG